MTPPTLRSERREKFEAILWEWIRDSQGIMQTYPDGDEHLKGEVRKVTELLADASLSRTERQQEEKPDIMDGILESEKLAQIEHAALLAFEAAFKIENGNIPWYKTKPEWTRLRKKLVEKHQADPEYFKKYRIWYNSEGKFIGGMNATQLSNNPAGFLLALDAYEAGNGEIPQLSDKPKQSIGT